jgi:hypothetical protein
VLAASPERLAQLRKNPGPIPFEKIAPSMLRAADEQTIVGLAAVLEATPSLPQPHDFSAWGVIAAPVHMGRAANHAALQRFREEGAWGISPNVIPQHSLHALSGVISQVLASRGPNFGIGNGPSSAAEAFLLAATMLADPTLPGLWVVLTGHEREMLPPQSPPACIAIALALQHATEAENSPSFVLYPHDPVDASHSRILEPLSLWSLASVLRDPLPSRSWRVGEFGRLSLDSCGDNA